MIDRGIIIGAIGGDGQESCAAAFGESLARAGCILLTGGRPQRGGEVKDASMTGAVSVEADGLAARLVGIIPSHVTAWDETHPRRLMLYTGLEHNLRNVINGLTPDVLVVFGGSRGTLAEAAFALAAGKPLFLTCGATTETLERLRRNFAKYFGEGSPFDRDIDLYLGAPLRAYQHAWERPPSTRELKDGLAEFLAKEPDLAAGPDDLVASCRAAVPDAARFTNTGFPGLPGDARSKARFEEIILRLSRTRLAMILPSRSTS
jgi:uncharacterized protein (TIGR00725 family)